jgi:hypothetical protein
VQDRRGQHFPCLQSDVFDLVRSYLLLSAAEQPTTFHSLQKLHGPTHCTHPISAPLYGKPRRSAAPA